MNYDQLTHIKKLFNESVNPPVVGGKRMRKFFYYEIELQFLLKANAFNLFVIYIDESMK